MVDIQTVSVVIASASVVAGVAYYGLSWLPLTLSQDDIQNFGLITGWMVLR